MKKQFFLIIVLLPVLCFTQGEWEWQNPWPQGADLVKIQAINKNKIISSGQNSTILITENGGIDWQLNKLPGRSSIRGLCFLDSLVGYVINVDKTFKTLDGGNVWEETSPQISKESLLLKDIRFFNENHGWLLTDCGYQKYYDDPVNNSGKLYETRDKGDTWTETVIGPVGCLIKMCFPDSLSGFILSEETTGYYLIRTLNGGVTWTKTMLPILSNADPNSLFFLSAKHGWYGEYVTIDGGNTWDVGITTLSADEFINNIYFYGVSTGWIITRYEIYRQELEVWNFNYRILYTTDGGENWVVQKENLFEEISEIHFIDEQYGWLCGKNGTLYKTENSGQEWLRITRGNPWNLYDIDFVNETTGWAVGNEGTILATKNGGQTWLRQESNVINSLKTVDFIDENNGWAAGDVGGGIILHTNNSGDSWEVQLNDKQKSLRDIFFVDLLHGWAVGNKGLILKTETGGISWTLQTSNTIETLAEVYFTDLHHGWACGYLGTMLSTTNGGVTWQHKSLDAGFLRTLQFTDRNHGWCSDGDEASFCYTTDGGITWQRLPDENYCYDIYGFQSFFFINNNIGWGGGFLGGDIATTIDGGMSWQFQERINAFSINDLYFIDENNGWAITGNSILHYKDNSTLITSHNSVHKPKVNNFRVFPNPFNSATTLYYELDRSQEISIQIYDILGKQITTLYQGRMEQGQHKTTWNAENIPSGIYFVTIIGQDFKQTIKCMMVK